MHHHYDVQPFFSRIACTRKHWTFWENWLSANCCIFLFKRFCNIIMMLQHLFSRINCTRKCSTLKENFCCNLSSAELLAPTRVQLHRTNYSKYVKNHLGKLLSNSLKKEVETSLWCCSLTSAEFLAQESIEPS